MEKPLFTKSAKLEIKHAIKESSDNEVFFVGSVNENKLVYRVEVVARGNTYSVPAIVDSAYPGQVVIHNHPSGDLTPSDQDIQIASVFGNQGVGFYIVNNTAAKAYVVVEAFTEKEITPIDTEELKRYLRPEGRTAELMQDNYELRDEQLSMVEVVANGFNNDRLSLIEAGTGTGKTLAYLIPAVMWALRNEQRVVISTNTINLQEQLFEKDIPLVHKAFDGNFKYSLVKGMSNYLCLLRAETVNDGLFEMADDDEIDSINSILDWAKFTEDGSLSDLSFSPPDSVWDKVSAESDSCIRARCPYYSRCFFYQSRREIVSSEIIVVNHHLLFADLAIKSASEKSDAGILPPFKRLIIDEAHHMSDAATTHFGMRATKFGIIRILRRLKRKGRKGEIRGLINFTASLATKLIKFIRKGILNDVLRRVDENLSPRVDRVEEGVRDSFDSLYQFAITVNRLKGDSGNDVNLRVTEEITSQEGWEDIDRKFSMLRIRIKELHEEIKAFTDILLDYESENDVAKLIVEFRGVYNKLDYYSDVISTFLSLQDDGYVRWVEGRPGRGGAIISGLGLSPLDISSTLKERLYSKCDTVVMTSATLTVRNNFEFMKSGLGLMDDERVAQSMLPSPFNYEEQLLLTIPNDIPEPSSPKYAEKIIPLIAEAVKASNGNALILFTSYSLLETVYQSIYQELENSGILALKQGLLPRGRLLDKFRIEEGSVLFATDSFWEGVDVPGDALRLVVICRLPFRVPTEPIIEARVEHMEKEGVNSFMEYSVPVAVLKFKQGFGRLIRSKTDKGAVLVLDKRVISKFYGKYFLESLPGCTRIVDTSRKVMNELRVFFDGL